MDVSMQIIRSELAPLGRLRVAINLGNPVLAQRAADGALAGVSVDLAWEIAVRLGVEMELSNFATAGAAVAALQDQACDLAFLAIDPDHRAVLDYTAPYVRIEASYLVPSESRFRSVRDVDVADVTIASGLNTAYDLFLNRSLKQARRIHTPSSQAALALFLEGGADVCAGVRQTLEAAARDRAGVRLLPDSFQAIDQAVALPRERPHGRGFLEALLKDLVASGFVARRLVASGQDAALAIGPGRPAPA